MVPRERRQVAESCLDFLAMAMVEFYRSRSTVLLLPPPPPPVSTSPAHRLRHPDVIPELPGRRIGAIGFQVGCQLVERYTKERPRFSDHLEAIKFICKDFWAEVFNKQVDNLKTNHRGIFVLQDNRFRWLTRISLDAPAYNEGGISLEAAISKNNALTARATGEYLYFPCGLIRGALTSLGVPCDVSAEVGNLPAFLVGNARNLKKDLGWILYGFENLGSISTLYHCRYMA